MPASVLQIVGPQPIAHADLATVADFIVEQLPTSK
jgi:hypothetical protein